MPLPKRMVGFCTNEKCDHGRRGVLLPVRDEAFICPRCERPGMMEWERGVIRGDGALFSEVRVEYDFDPQERCYRKVARIRDESVLRTDSVYTLQSPFIHTRRYAVNVAEALLRNLNQDRDAVDREDPRRPLRTRSDAA